MTAPAATGTHNEITLSIHADCRTVRVGQALHLRVIASGDRRPPDINSHQIEGMTTVGQPGCGTVDPEEKEEPGVTMQDLEHRYLASGVDRIVVGAETFCSRFTGSATAEMSIDVRP